MSYLLEALRKSERERQEKTAVPGLQTPTVEWEPGDENRSRSPWLMVAVLAIFLNTLLLAVLVWRFGIVDSTKAERAATATTEANNNPQTAASTPVAAPAMPAVIVVQQPREPTAAIVVRERDPNDAMRPTLTRLPANTTSARQNPATNQYVDDGASLQTDTENDNRRRAISTDSTGNLPTRQPTNAPAITSLSSDEAPPSVHALPIAVREQLPLLTMNSHIYANNVRDSFVMINGVSLAPGDEISRGLFLIAVVPEGAVFDFNGQRFLLPALANFSP